MIGIATFSLLAAWPYPADGVSASQAPPAASAGTVTGLATPPADVNVPKQAGPWVRPDAPRRITEETIFDYMDGAGELYLAYRFGHLDVYDYAAPEQSLGAIKVELYWMKSTDDAFGLLSTDWGGEAIDLRAPGGGRRPAATGASTGTARGLYRVVPPDSALYGGGLLRFWSGDLYGRIMATRESEASRAQVLAIARAIVSGRPANDQPPKILAGIPARWGGRFEIRPDRTCFFRSHYVLNSVYYLAPDDILNLGPAIDASISEFRTTGASGSSVHLVQVVYPSAETAASGFEAFLKSYLPAPARQRAERSGAAAAKAEGGWAGWAAADRALAIVLGAPGEPDAKDLARAALAALIRER